MEQENWFEATLTPFEDYYLIEMENDGDVEKIWWEYEKEDFGVDSDSYYTEDGRKIIFNYDEQEIWFYYEYSENEDRYYKLLILSKLEILEK